MDLMRISPADAAQSLLLCNAVTTRYGLRLTDKDAAALAETQSRALISAGRVAFAGGIANDLAVAFCDSPYIQQDNYTETLSGLIEAFYDFKNETLDEMDDAEAVTLMKRLFDGKYCEGSLDRLVYELLPEAARCVRAGLPPERDDGGEPEDEHDE